MALYKEWFGDRCRMTDFGALGKEILAATDYNISNPAVSSQIQKIIRILEELESIDPRLLRIILFGGIGYAKGLLAGIEQELTDASTGKS